jgi:dienelactone hydrolase
MPSASGTRRALIAARRVATHPVWREIATPFARTAAWYVRSGRRSNPQPGTGDARVATSAVPVVKPDLALAGQALVDELVLAAIRFRHRPIGANEMTRMENEVADAVALYERMGWLADPASFHRGPPAPYDARLRRAWGPGAAFEVLSFTSGYEPHRAEPGRDRWLADEPNATEYAWVLRHREPRPWIVCVHGAAMGQALADLRVFRAQWLFEELGLNVALPIQARHGPRRAGAPFGIGWPGEDMLDNVHAIAQSVWDIRRVIAWIRAQEPNPTIAVHGLSLGGYTTALVAGLEPDLACVIAGVPAIDFAELMDRHAPARIKQQPGYDRISDLARQALRVVSPLAIPPRVPVERRFIYAGLADRLVHPQHQIHELWTQWQQPEINWFRGSHVGFFFSRPVQAFIVDALQRTGVLAIDAAAAEEATQT